MRHEACMKHRTGTKLISCSSRARACARVARVLYVSHGQLLFQKVKLAGLLPAQCSVHGQSPTQQSTGIAANIAGQCFPKKKCHSWKKNGKIGPIFQEVLRDNQAMKFKSKYREMI